LKSADIIWTDDTLDEWIKDPQHFIPGNTMTFPGMKDARQRADLLAFLKDATQPGRAPKTAQGGNQMGGMMMGGGAVPNLKTLDPQGPGAVDPSLRRYLQGRHRGREGARFLGTEFALQDRCQRRWSAKGRAGPRGSRYDGRPSRRDFRRARGDQRIHQSPVLTPQRRYRSFLIRRGSYAGPRLA